MKYFILMLALISIRMPALAEDVDSGKQLHNEYCLSCHSSAIYTRGNRIVNNFKELTERVRQCELANDLTWFDEDINAVITYLNTTYYKFETN